MIKPICPNPIDFRRTKLISKITAQEIQDKIFMNMSADKKIEVGSILWRMAKDLIGDKIHYGKDRSKKSFG